jgi:aryl-alcohol dehydrogenase-like predicted oxidoreductase
MIRRDLGSTGLSISITGWGGFAAGGFMWGSQDDADSAAAIRAALEAGVNWLDTAPLYGEGKADAVVGAVLRELPASQRPMVFTKFGHHVVDGKRVTDGSRAQVIADCEHALRTFGVETIDLFQLHWPATQTVAETAGACADLIKAGKVRHVGLCNADVGLCEAWRAVCPLASVQNIYHVFRPEAAADVIPWCASNNVGFLAYSPLYRGMLFGTWTADKTFPAGDHRGERDDFRGPRLARYVQAVDEMKAIASEDDLDVAELAIGCLTCTEGLSGVIVGARNAAQGAYLGRLGMPVRAKQLEAVEAIVERCRKDLG